MFNTLLQYTKYSWHDGMDIQADELEALAEQYQLHWSSLEDCMQPRHMPKVEKFAQYTFLIVRVYDHSEDIQHARREDSIRGMTRKIGIFFNAHWMITLHSRPLALLAQTAAEYVHDEASILRCPPYFAVIKAALLSFEAPLERIEDDLEEYERAILQHIDIAQALRDKHQARHRLALLKRLLWQTLAALQKMPVVTEYAPLLKDLEETCEALYLHAERLNDSFHRLLELQLALSAHRTNQIIEVLTVFSIFFMPPTLIAGIYGMNFENMPELAWPYGYALIWEAMLLTTLGLSIWFRRRRWL